MTVMFIQLSNFKVLHRTSVQNERRSRRSMHLLSKCRGYYQKHWPSSSEDHEYPQYISCKSNMIVSGCCSPSDLGVNLRNVWMKDGCQIKWYSLPPSCPYLFSLSGRVIILCGFITTCNAFHITHNHLTQFSVVNWITRELTEGKTWMC